MLDFTSFTKGKEMSSDANASRSWHASSRPQLKFIASHIIETLSPRLFWRLKARRIRRYSSEYELRVAPLLCDIRKISVDIPYTYVCGKAACSRSQEAWIAHCADNGQFQVEMAPAG